MASILLLEDPGAAPDACRAALTVAGHEVRVAKDPSHLGLEGPQRFDLVLVTLQHASHAAALAAVASRVVLFTDASEEETRRYAAQSGLRRYIRRLGPTRLLDDVQRELSR